MASGVRNRGVSLSGWVLMGVVLALTPCQAQGQGADPTISGGPGSGSGESSCCSITGDFLKQGAIQEAKNRARSMLQVEQQTFSIPLGAFPKSSEERKKSVWVTGTLGIKGSGGVSGSLFEDPAPSPSPSPSSSPSPSPSPAPAVDANTKTRQIKRETVSYKVDYGVTLWAAVGSKEETFANQAIVDFKSSGEFGGTEKTGQQEEKTSISKRILLFGVTVDVWANLFDAMATGASLASADADQLSKLGTSVRDKVEARVVAEAKKEALKVAQQELNPYLHQVPDSLSFGSGGTTVAGLGQQKISSCANDWNGPWQFRVDLNDICKLGGGAGACQNASQVKISIPPDIIIEFRVGFFASLALSIDLKVGAPGINSTMTLNNDIAALKEGVACSVDAKATAKKLWGQFKFGLAPVLQTAVTSAEMVGGASIRLAKAISAYRAACQSAQDYYASIGKKFDCTNGIAGDGTSASNGVDALSCQEQQDLIEAATAEEREYLTEINEARNERNEAWLGLGMMATGAAMNFFEYDSDTGRIKTKDSVKEEIDDLADQYRNHGYLRLGFGTRLDARVSVWFGVGVGVGLGPLNVTVGIIGNLNLVDMSGGAAVSWDTRESSYLDIDGKYNWRLLTGNMEIYAKGEAFGTTIEFREPLITFDENGVSYGSFLSSLNQAPPPERKVLFDNQVAIGDLAVPQTKWSAVPNENWRFVSRDSKIFRIDLREFWKDVTGASVPGSGRSTLVNCWNMSKTPSTVDPRCFSDNMPAGERALTEAYARVQQGYVAPGPQNTLEEKNCAIEIGTGFLTAVRAESKEDCLGLADAIPARLLAGESEAPAVDPRVQLIFSEYMNSCAQNPAGCFVTHSTQDQSSYQLPIQMTYEMTSRDQLASQTSEVPDFYGQRKSVVELKIPGVQSISFGLEDAPSRGISTVPSWAKHPFYSNRRPSMSPIATGIYRPIISGGAQVVAARSALLLPKPAQLLSLSLSENPDSNGKYSTSQIVVKPGLGLSKSAYGILGDQSQYQSAAPTNLPKVNSSENHIRRIRPEAPSDPYLEFPEDLMINIGDLDPIPSGFFPSGTPTFGGLHPSTLDGHYVELSYLPLLSDAELFQLAYSSKLGTCRLDLLPEKSVHLVRDDQVFVGDNSDYFSKSSGLEIKVNGVSYPENADPEGRVIYNLIQGRGGVTPSESILGNLVKLDTVSGLRIGRYYKVENLDLSNIPQKEAKYAAAQLRAALLGGECFPSDKLRLLTQMTSISKAEFWAYFDTDKIKNAAIDMDSPDAVEDKRVIGDFFRGGDNKYCTKHSSSSFDVRGVKYGRWSSEGKNGNGCFWRNSNANGSFDFGDTQWGQINMRVAFGCSFGIVGVPNRLPSLKYWRVPFDSGERSGYESQSRRGRLWFVYSGTSLISGGSYNAQLAQARFGQDNYVLGDSYQVNPLVYLYDGNDFKCSGISNDLASKIGNQLYPDASYPDQVYDYVSGRLSHYTLAGSFRSFGAEWSQKTGIYFWDSGGWNNSLINSSSVSNYYSTDGWMNDSTFKRSYQLQRTIESIAQNNTLKNNLGAQLRACLSVGPCELISGEVTLLTGTPTDPSGSQSTWDRLVDLFSGKENRTDLAEGDVKERCTLAFGGGSGSAILLGESISGKPLTRDATSLQDCQFKFSDVLKPEFCAIPEIVAKAQSEQSKAIAVGGMKYFNVNLFLTPKMGLSEFMQGSSSPKTVGRCVYEVASSGQILKPIAPLLSASDATSSNPAGLVTCRLSYSAQPSSLGLSPLPITIKEHKVKPNVGEGPLDVCVRALALIPPTSSSGTYVFDQGSMISNAVLQRALGTSCESRRVSKSTENFALQFSYTQPGLTGEEGFVPVKVTMDWGERGSINPINCQDQPQCQLVVTGTSAHPIRNILPDGQKIDFSPSAEELALGGTHSEICTRAAKSTFGSQSETISCGKIANMPFFAPFRKPIGATSSYATSLEIASKWAHEEQFSQGPPVTCDQSATGPIDAIVVRGFFAPATGNLNVPYIKAFDSDPFKTVSGSRAIDQKIPVSVLNSATGQVSTVQVTAAFVEALAWMPPEIRFKKAESQPAPLGELKINFKSCSGQLVPYNLSCPSGLMPPPPLSTGPAVLEAEGGFVLNEYVYIPKNRCARVSGVSNGSSNPYSRMAEATPLHSLDGPIEWELAIRGLEGMNYLKQSQTQTCARELSMQSLTGDPTGGDRVILAVRGDFKSEEVYPDPFTFGYSTVSKEVQAIYFRDGVFNPKFSALEQGSLGALEARFGGSQIEQTCQLAREVLYHEDGYQGPVSLYLSSVGSDGKIQMPLTTLQDQLTERARAVCQGPQYGRCQLKLTTTSGIEELIDFSKSNIFVQSGGRAKGMEDCEAEIKDLQVCSLRDKLNSISDLEGFSASAVFKPGFSGDADGIEKAIGECAPRSEPRKCEIGFKTRYPDSLSYWIDGFTDFYKIEELDPYVLNGYLGSSSSDFAVPLGFAPWNRSSCLAYAERLKSMCSWSPVSGEGFDRTSPYKVVTRWGTEEVPIETCHAAPRLTANSNPHPDGAPVLGAGASALSDLGIDLEKGTITIQSEYPGDAVGLGGFFGSYDGISLELERSFGNDCKGPFVQVFSGPADSFGSIQYPISDQDEGKSLCFRSRVHGSSGYSGWTYLAIEVPGSCLVRTQNGSRPDDQITTIQRMRVANATQCDQVIKAVSCLELQNAAQVPTTRDTPLLPVFAGREVFPGGKVCGAWEDLERQSCYGFFNTGWSTVKIPGLELPYEVIESASTVSNLILPPFNTWKNCAEELAILARQPEVCEFVRRNNVLTGQDTITVFAGMDLESGRQSGPVLECLPEIRLASEYNSCTATIRWNSGLTNASLNAVLTSSSGITIPLGDIGSSGTHGVDEWVQNAGYNPSDFFGKILTLQATSSLPGGAAQYGPKSITFPFLNPVEICQGGEVLSEPVSSMMSDGCLRYITWEGMKDPASKVEIKLINSSGVEVYHDFHPANEGGQSYKFSLKDTGVDPTILVSVMIRARVGDKVSNWHTYSNQAILEASCGGATPLVVPAFTIECNVIKFGDLYQSVEIEGTDARGNVFVVKIESPGSPIDFQALFAEFNPFGGIVKFRIRQVQGELSSGWSVIQEISPCGGGDAVKEPASGAETPKAKGPSEIPSAVNEVVE